MSSINCAVLHILFCVTALCHICMAVIYLAIYRSRDKINYSIISIH